KYQNNTFKLSLLGIYQKYNAALAIEIIRYLFKEISIDTIKLGLATTIYGGRLETVLDGVVLDGAHNMHAIEALILSLHSVFKMYNIHVLFSALSDKEPQKMLEALAAHLASITRTAISNTRYVPV